MITKLTIDEVEYISFTLAKELMGWKEPIPDFHTRFPNILESSLRVPFQTFDGKNLYKGLIDKAAILFYLMIKNHPFKNGNKRIAMTTLFVFLYVNGKWLKVDNRELYTFAVWVAESNAMFQEGVVTSIRKFLTTYLVER